MAKDVPREGQEIKVKTLPQSAAQPVPSGMELRSTAKVKTLTPQKNHPSGWFFGARISFLRAEVGFFDLRVFS